MKGIEKDEQSFFRSDVGGIICSTYKNRLKQAGRFENWLIMRFADTENADSLDAFTPGHAELIKTFIDGLGENVRRLYICSDRCESRGQAIRAALTLYFGGSDMDIWTSPEYHPNTLVYETLLRAFGIRYPHIKMVLRKRHSVKALKRAVKRGRRGRV